MKTFGILSLIALLGCATALDNFTVAGGYTVVPCSTPSASPTITVTKVNLSQGRLDKLNNEHAFAMSQYRMTTCTWQAFSGYACDGNDGQIVAVDKKIGKCRRIRDRRSFYFSSTCPALCVNVFDNHDCGRGDLGDKFNAILQGLRCRDMQHVFSTGCYNVNATHGWTAAFVARTNHKNPLPTIVSAANLSTGADD